MYPTNPTNALNVNILSIQNSITSILSTKLEPSVVAGINVSVNNMLLQKAIFQNNTITINAGGVPPLVATIVKQVHQLELNVNFEIVINIFTFDEIFNAIKTNLGVFNLPLDVQVNVTNNIRQFINANFKFTEGRLICPQINIIPQLIDRIVTEVDTIIIN